MDENGRSGTSIVTLGLALEWIKTAPLAEIDKRDLRSAIRRACHWSNRSPDEVPANPKALRQLFKSVSPGGAGVTKKTISNVKSELGRLLDLMGLSSRKAHKCPLSLSWHQHLDVVSNEDQRCLLTRFARFCSGRGIEPNSVSDLVAAEFLASLEFEMRVARPKPTHRETLRQWNKYWPRQLLTIPSYSRKYVLDWGAFNLSLIGDIDSYLSKKATGDAFDLSAPIRDLKASTIATYRDRLRRFGSCLVLAGTGVCQLRSLSDLVQREAVERGLRYLAYDRKAKPLAAAIGTLLAMIARDHVGQPAAEVNVIAEIAARLRANRKGLAPRVRERLAPLKHEANLARLFLLPTALTRSLQRKSNPAVGDACLFQRALALALLTVCPLRISSLCAIRIDRHLNWSMGPMKGDLIIEFASGELKNDEPASFPIPREVGNLIRSYCVQFRPLLNPQGSPFLFCGADPTRPRNRSTFSRQLSNLTFERLGLWVNPHLYRHVVHLVVLRRFPGAYAMVARVLTHRSITTTVQNYSHFDGELAMQAYQRLVQGVKGDGSSEDGPDLAAAAYAFDQGACNDAR